MKILFAGTPEIAIPSLETLAAEFDVVGVLTAPDTVSGRGKVLTPPPVKVTGERLDIPVFQPAALGSAAREQISPLGADLLVVFAYGRIFGPRFLELFPLGGINMHPSALPKYRGPSPLIAAILHGDDQTALTVQRISLEMDAGDIMRQTFRNLNGTETTESLTHDVALAAAPELVLVVKEMENGYVRAMPQDHSSATYCHRVQREDGNIDWHDPARLIERKVRAYTPWPRCHTTLRGESLAVLEASALPGTGDRSIPGTVTGVDKSRGILIQTGDGILAVSRLQLASRKPLDFRSFLNGVTLEVGIILGVNS